MAPGFLCVFSEPGEQVPLEEFQDWYNNEHIPLRLNHLPSFLTGARYSAADNKVPSWVALYDIDNTATFRDNSYSRLRANRSMREGNLVKRLQVLDRRTCEYVYDSGESALTSSLKYDNPTKTLVTLGVTLEGGNIQSWAADMKDRLSVVDGWVRTRAFLCFDSLKTGTGIPEGPEAQVVPKYLVIHEFTSPSLLENDIVNSVLAAPELKEIRTWQLYRAYPCVAQGNLPI